jgi:hypothetical protein
VTANARLLITGLFEVVTFASSGTEGMELGWTMPAS